MNIEIYKANHVLRAINIEEFEFLKPNIEYVEFQPGLLSNQRNPDIPYVYFVLSGIFAMTIQVDRQDTTLVLLGHDSLIDCRVPLDNGLDVVNVTCLTKLTAYAMPASALTPLISKAPGLIKGLSMAIRNLFMKMARATAWIQNHSSHQRLAKWLLRASDLTESQRLEISHQALAQLLGIRRVGVTLELGKLKAENAITTGYGWIEVKDRNVLEQHACSCYRASSMGLKP